MNLLIQTITTLDVDLNTFLQKLTDQAQKNILNNENNLAEDLAVLKSVITIIYFNDKAKQEVNSAKETGIQNEDLKKLIYSLCLPIFKTLHLNAQKIDQHVLSETCELLMMILKLMPEEEFVYILNMCDQSLIEYINFLKYRLDNSSENICDTKITHIHPECAIVILKHVLDDQRISILKQWKNDNGVQSLLKRLKELLLCCNEHFCSLILTLIIPKLIANLDIHGKISIFQMLVEAAFSFYSYNYFDASSKNTHIGYLIFLNVWDRLKVILDTGFVHDIFNSPKLWHIIQQGLVHHDPLNRKRSMFIFQKIIQDLENNIIPFPVTGEIFWWKIDESTKLANMWSNFILILETLEERQVHLIKPVLPRLNELISFTRKNHLLENNNYYLHISWIAILFQRMFVHESRFINRWGISNFLQLSLSKENLIEDKLELFICHPLLECINNPSIFACYDEDLKEKCPTVATLLITFLQNCNANLQGSEHHSQFFTSLLKQITLQTWNTTSLLYMSQALSTLPEIHVWNEHSILLLRDFLTTVLKTQEVYLRGAIQCFLLKALLKLTDINDVSLMSIAKTLAVFRGDESLQRGTKLWNEICKWLKRNFELSSQNSVSCFLSKENIMMFCKKLLASLMDENSVSEDGKDNSSICPRKVARLIVLMIDANILSFESTNNLMFPDIFLPLHTLLSSFNLRPYLNENNINYCLNFVLGILEEISLKQESRLDSVQNALINWLEPNQNEILKFICNKLPWSIRTFQDLDRLELYIEILQGLSEVSRNNKHFFNHVNKLGEASFSVLLYNKQEIEENLENQLQNYSALRCAAWICKFLKLHDRNMLSTPVHKQIIEFIHVQINSKELCSSLKKLETKSPLHRLHQSCWGRLVSDYMCCKWKCLDYYLINSAYTIDPIDITTQALSTLSVSADIGDIICICLKGILPKILDVDETLFLNILDHLWNAIFEQRKTDFFWSSITQFVQMLFQPDLLQRSNFNLLEKYIDLALNLSDKTPTVYCILVFHCCKIWQENHSSLEHYLKILTNALIFGFVHRKDQKITNEAAAYICSLGDECSSNIINESYIDASYVRIAAIGIILNLSPESRCDSVIARKLLYSMLEREKELTLHRVRYFGNSLTHRIKNRIWQIVLLLEPLYPEETQYDLIEIVYKELMKEGSQPSVRLYQEWLAMRILQKFPFLRENFWNVMKKAASLRVGSIVSFLAIISHLAKIMDNPIEKNNFMLIALSKVLPWCMAQNFNVRVTAQVTFHFLWQICKESNLVDVLNLYKSVETCLEFTVNNGSASKNTLKLLEDFYYSAFHCNNHYSLQSIFYEFPRLYCLAPDEWISPSSFIQRIPSLGESNNKLFISVFNKNNVLADFEKSLWLTRTNGGFNDQNESDEIVIGSENIQKKAIPCKQLLMDEQGILPDECEKHSQKGLVVVASIIERIPNLGGLCRTCEIFGATEYVIGSLKYIEDKQFQNLSVSSEKWISIKEVKRQHLKDYLLFMRENGYMLVGAEQTAYSCKLDCFQFPVKTLLLLGNEKEGIPADLIQLLDVCLEIPQRGIIRSLNVHVSGAVIIWEYARQHLIKDVNS